MGLIERKPTFREVRRAQRQAKAPQRQRPPGTTVARARVQSPAAAAKYTLGPGAALKAILKWVWWRPCGACSDFAAMMDRWGPDRCEQRIDEILTHLRNQAKRRGVPYSNLIATQAVKMAIFRSRKSGLCR
jgi:hypothetical protein